jgi:hypothetical protein
MFSSYFSEHKTLAPSHRFENVTQTITRILEGYDIRLRPNFGGKTNIQLVRIPMKCIYLIIYKK